MFLFDDLEQKPYCGPSYFPQLIV